MMVACVMVVQKRAAQLRGALVQLGPVSSNYTASLNSYTTILELLMDERVDMFESRYRPKFTFDSYMSFDTLCNTLTI